MFEMFSRNYKNPATEAMPYFDQIGAMGRSTFNPYINAGKEALDINQEQFQRLIEDPTSLIAQILSNYEGSPLQTQTMDDAMRAILMQSAAGGQLGTIPSQINAGRVAGDISNRFQNDYLDRALGLYGQGLGGMSHIFDTGFRGSEDLADLEASLGMNRAQAKMWEQAYNNQRQSNMFNDLGKFVGGLSSFFR